MTTKNLTSNMEDYLEAIMTLQEEQKVARVRDIARQLKVKMPSVTGAVRNLAEKGLVNYERYSFVTLTEKGRKIAKEIISRHQLLYDFLTRVLLVDMEIAELDACRIEHAISPQTATKLKEFLADYTPTRQP
ncbi:MAG: metal-dependent transcriptional regulator [Dissulfuribacterales bacterium]